MNFSKLVVFLVSIVVSIFDHLDPHTMTTRNKNFGLLPNLKGIFESITNPLKKIQNIATLTYDTNLTNITFTHHRWATFQDTRGRQNSPKFPVIFSLFKLSLLLKSLAEVRLDYPVIWEFR